MVGATRVKILLVDSLYSRSSTSLETIPDYPRIFRYRSYLRVDSADPGAGAAGNGNVKDTASGRVTL